MYMRIHDLWFMSRPSFPLLCSLTPTNAKMAQAGDNRFEQANLQKLREYNRKSSSVNKEHIPIRDVSSGVIENGCCPHCLSVISKKACFCLSCSTSLSVHPCLAMAASKNSRFLRLRRKLIHRSRKQINI